MSIEPRRGTAARAAVPLTGTEEPAWGMHDFDVSEPLGNLIDLVRVESTAYEP
jgi:hypothetical protein